MARQSLVTLLHEDPLGALTATVMRTESLEEEQATRRFPAFPEVAESLRAAFQHPEKRQVIASTDWSDPEQVDSVSELIGVTTQNLLRYRRERDVVRQAALAVTGIPNLRRSWALLLRSAPIEETTGSKLPSDDERPFLVLFTADWCRWCWVVKPTFARLSHDVTETKLFYTNDEDLARAECEDVFWPQLVAYREDGTKAAGQCGDTTRELWEAMHRLVGSPTLVHA